MPSLMLTLELVPEDGAADEGDPVHLHEQEQVMGGSAPMIFPVVPGGTIWALATCGRSVSGNTTNARRFLMTTNSELLLQPPP
jgi:hypothetical protein